MKLPTDTSAPDASVLLSQEYRVSWAGLASPLRSSPRMTPIPFRHTPLVDVWQTDDK